MFELYDREKEHSSYGLKQSAQWGSSHSRPNMMPRLQGGLILAHLYSCVTAHAQLGSFDLEKV